MDARFANFADRDTAYLEALLNEGVPCTAEEIAGFVYDGLSVGLPAVINRFVEKFRKVFVVDTARGDVRGWNQRMVQNGPDAAWTPALVRGKPVIYGHYVVTPAADHPRYDHYRQALVIDYGRGGNLPLDPLSRVVDYVTPVETDAEGEPSLLLGRMYLDLRVRVVPTPSYFLLARAERVTQVETPPR